ncbi:MAG: PstS family phosphate ABC transporter substrate-binding protein [Acidimicrobiia bacterium]
MSMFRSARLAVAASAAALVLALSASAAGAGGDLSGEVNVSGSSTVEPITSLVGELFAGENADVSVRVDGPGTGDGFQLFCNGETDISDASRPIEEEEVATCESNGIEYTELQVAIDGLTIVANPDSDIECLDTQQIYALFGPESSNSLADAQTLAEELGSENDPLPSGDVTKFTPGPESGTYDSFIEITYEDLMGERLEAGAIPPARVGTNDEGEQEVTEPLLSDGQFPNDNDIVQRVEGSSDGIGFFGFAFFEENQEDLKAVRVYNEETGRCVKPTRKSIRRGTYPISRPLFIYPNTARAADNEAVQAFVDFYMTPENLTDVVTESGYVPMSGSQIDENIGVWESAGS